MRLRDLRWYILASIIIIISYAGIAFSYYTSIESGKVVKSMKAINEQWVGQTKTLVDDKINELYTLYVNDVDNKLVKAKPGAEEGLFTVSPEQVTVQSNYDNYHLEGMNYVLAPRNKIEGKTGSGDSADINYYYYFKADKVFMEQASGEDKPNKVMKPQVASISMADALSFIAPVAKVDLANEENTNRAVVIFDTPTKSQSLAKVRYTNTVDLKDIVLNTPLQNISYDSYKDGLINLRYTASGIDCILSGVSLYEGITIAVITPTNNILLGISWVKTQAWVFFVATVVVSVAMLVLLVLGCRRASKLLRADRHAVEATMSVVIRIDLHGKVIFTNKTFKKMYGSSKLLDISGFVDVETEEPIMKSIKNNKSFECMVEVEGVKHYLHLSPLYISRSYYLMGNEITIDYKARKHLEVMSGKNENTHCENGFMLANQFEKILETNAGYDIAFIEYNIYKYDELISIFGRTSYIELLNQYLGVLRNSFQDIGIYHMTDSKFIVVLPNKSIDEVTIRVNETMKEFKKPIVVKENSIYVRTKVVVYNLTQDIIDDANLDDIKTKLDLAYRNMAQLSSKDFIVYDPVMDSVILAADVMEHDIEIGLENDEFEMYLQPQFDVVSKRIAGFESLIRWNNPKYKDKSPQAFIELAEQRGHMLEIGKFVVRESFKLAKKLEVYKVSVSVNISPVQLLQVGFVQSLIDEADSLELNPSTIAIEITETLLMENFQLVNEKLKLLKAKGFTIHLDDFCTGYSSMQYLKDFPVDAIKIDKGFTMYVETSKVHETICRTICNLATALDLGIVCEGVENEAQAEIIKKMGCRIIQGFLIGKAMPYDEAVALIEKYKR